MSTDLSVQPNTRGAAGGEVLLSVCDLVVAGASGRRIVDGVSFTVKRGESVAIVGESGSGKTMTAKALIGLLPKGVSAEGDVEFDGSNLPGLGNKELQPIRGEGVSLLMQDPFTMLNPLTKVRTHLVETMRSMPGRKLTGKALNDDVQRRLAEVGIHEPDVMHKYPSELSGGMRQRVAIAASIVKDPKLLIADEPTTALDATTQREVLKLIHSIQKERGMSMMLVTHDLRVAFAVCDRVLVMYAGSIIEVAQPAQLQAATAHPYTHGLLKAEPSLEVRKPVLVGIPGRVPKPFEVETQCVFADRCDFASDLCRAARPDLRSVGDDRLTACLRAEEIAAELMVHKQDASSSVESGATATQDILVVESLVKQYVRGKNAGEPALKGVSLRLGAGRSLGVVGESGSGKTTLARCLLGLEKPTSGSIVVDGIDLVDYDALSSENRRTARELVQCVFQDPYSSLNPAHTIRFILSEAARQRRGGSKLSKKQLDEEIVGLLNDVGLPASYAKRRPAALSGGERQRIAIARALAVKPRLLICDEPVAALDVSVQAQVLEVLRAVARNGVTLLFITHDLAVARQITDEVVVLLRGSIVETGDTGSVLRSPEHDYTRRLVDAVPSGGAGWLD